MVITFFWLSARVVFVSVGKNSGLWKVASIVKLVL